MIEDDPSCHGDVLKENRSRITNQLVWRSRMTGDCRPWRGGASKTTCILSSGRRDVHPNIQSSVFKMDHKLKGAPSVEPEWVSINQSHVDSAHLHYQPMDSMSPCCHILTFICHRLHNNSLLLQLHCLLMVLKNTSIMVTPETSILIWAASQFGVFMLLTLPT